MRIHLRVAAALALSGLLAAVAAGPAHAEDLQAPAGVAPVVGMAFEGDSSTLWLAGAAADEGVLTTADGERTVSYGGNPQSVQALAWKDDRLWIGDIGDEAANRDFVVVFRLNSLDGQGVSFNAFDFEYEDGPQDAKAMLISGRGRIYIVTSGDNPGIYRAPMEPSRQEMNTLERVSDAPAGVTDGVFLSDGSTMVLRSAAGLDYIDALTWEPMFVNTLVGAQADESVTADADDVLYVGGNPTIRETALVTADTTTEVATGGSPSASASAAESPSTPPATEATSDPSAAASSAPVVEAEPPSSSSPGRTGTLIALVAAAVVALTAGAVVAIRRT